MKVLVIYLIGIAVLTFKCLIRMADCTLSGRAEEKRGGVAACLSRVSAALLS